MTLLVLLNSGSALAGSINQVIVVKSSDNSYFNQTIKTLIESNTEEIGFETIELNDLNAIMKPIDMKHTVFISLGIRATKTIVQRFPDQPVISAYSTWEQIQNLSPLPGEYLAVLLDQPLERYLAFSHYLIKSKRPGIINQTPIKLSNNQLDILQRLKLNLSQYQTQRSADLLPAIRHLKQQSDALLMLPNQRLYNRDTLKGVLLTAYRNRIPIISYSPAHVKSGALASIFSSPQDIGKHLSELLTSHIHDPGNIQHGVRYARYYSIKTNSRVAHSLGFKIPSDSEIRQFLSKVLP